MNYLRTEDFTCPAVVGQNLILWCRKLSTYNAQSPYFCLPTHINKPLRNIRVF